jgi:predicted methyltransferase
VIGEGVGKDIEVERKVEDVVEEEDVVELEKDVDIENKGELVEKQKNKKIKRNSCRKGEGRGIRK